MDLIFLLVLPGVLWVQSWHMLGFYTNPRTLGIVAAAVAIVLLGAVLFQDNLGITPIYPAPGSPSGEFLTLESALSAFMLVWAVYSALVAGVYLWGLDTRSLGFYGLLLWIVSGVFAAYFFLGGELVGGDFEINSVSWLLGVVATLLAVLSALLFFYLTMQPASQPG